MIEIPIEVEGTQMGGRLSGCRDRVSGQEGVASCIAPLEVRFVPGHQLHRASEWCEDVEVLARHIDVGVNVQCSLKKR
jgi:hypothetical protein